MRKEKTLLGISYANKHGTCIGIDLLSMNGFVAQMLKEKNLNPGLLTKTQEQ